MKLETLLKIKAENDRFTERLNAAIEVANNSEYSMYCMQTQSKSFIKTEECCGCIEAGALKRSALDLKMVLTSITSPKGN